MKSGDSRRRRSAGFTLVELVVVVVLMGVMAALIVPEMRGTYGDAVLRSGGRDLANVCSIAASRAVSFNQPHRLHIDPSTGRFRVEKRARGRGPGSGPTFVPVRDVAGCDGTIDGRIRVEVRPGGAPEDDTSMGASAEESPAGNEPASAEQAGGDAERVPSQGLVFYPDGTADRGEIVLRDPEGFGLALRLNPTTARVRIVELPRR